VQKSHMDIDTPLHTMLNRPIVHQAQWVATNTSLIFQCIQEQNRGSVEQLRIETPIRSFTHVKTDAPQDNATVEEAESGINSQLLRVIKIPVAKDERKAHEKQKNQVKNHNQGA
jgi:hypothetical protein